MRGAYSERTYVRKERRVRSKPTDTKVTHGYELLATRLSSENPRPPGDEQHHSAVGMKVDIGQSSRRQRRCGRKMLG